MWSAFYMTGVLASLVASVYYSIQARRRGIHPLESRMVLGKMNVSLGILVSLFGLNQFTFDSLDTIRIVVALIMLIVGVMNLFLGTRNYFRYRTAWQTELKKGV
ncbi:YtpI family protein [Brevibacillus brevis]|uniref:YtpI family protein n=1 Tax=Brevibacillus brevis TaxID=1393 RepID=UPI0025A558D0|nr:YtpI family protein [Brevibacillus brevis]WJQ84496.1 YtpI family protein [Brevibacillus brevis]